MYELPELSDEARAFGERAGAALGRHPADRAAIADGRARGYDRNGPAIAEEQLRTKVAFNQAWNAWRDAARALAAAGREHFGLNWAHVAADLDSNRIRIEDGTNPRD